MAALFRYSLAVVFGSLALAFTPGTAKAIPVVTVNVGGTNYEVTYFSSAYNDDIAKFQAPPIGAMPWWGNKDLADSFAAAIESSLGLPNFSGIYGPVFAYNVATAPNIFGGIAVFGTIYNSSNPVGSRLLTNQAALVFDLAYAQAQAVAPVPGPLPLFGAAAAFGMSRRLRRRIQLGG